MFISFALGRTFILQPFVVRRGEELGERLVLGDGASDLSCGAMQSSLFFRCLLGESSVSTAAKLHGLLSAAQHTPPWPRHLCGGASGGL